ncbi:MAG: hypothetical protein ACK5NE_07620 [Brachymonas sp.]
MSAHTSFRSAFALIALCGAATAFAQDASAPSPSGARRGYRSAAAHEAAAARVSKFTREDESQYFRNALARCQNLPDGYKQDCEARVHGAGTRTGSVEGGGILRENEVSADSLP